MIYSFRRGELQCLIGDCFFIDTAAKILKLE